MKVPLLDLSAQYATIRAEIRQALYPVPFHRVLIALSLFQGIMFQLWRRRAW